MKQIYKLPIYVGIILKDNNHVLLVQRHNTDWMPQYWNFPEGLLEESETLIAAAQREIYKEVGVIVEKDHLILTQVLHVHANAFNTQNIMGVYFMATAWKDNPINKEPHRHAAVSWFDIQKLPTNITEQALLALESVLQGKKYNEHGW